MAENALTLKICVVGPCRTGKTLLCRALAEQPIIAGEYSATAAVRIQEFSRTIGVDRVKVQLWDCSGSMQYQSYWSVLGKVGTICLCETDLLLVITIYVNESFECTICLRE